ncbi:elongation factor P [Erythrobacter sp. MTPC3]|uniref:elongation factor P n=1 Tax=Erythrobacter sp. MTPC3 TaxID=3056564 RepID=UPI0036F2DD97
MKTSHVFMLTAFAAFVAAASPLMSQQSAPANAPGGMLRTMPHGAYQCALPGDAGGKAYEVVEAEGFSIGTASSYTSAQGRGNYILRGDRLTFTRGPKKGEQFERISTNQLRQLNASGKRTKLRCIRLGGNS